MEIYEFGNREADIVLIQPVDEYDLAGIENEVRVIRETTGEAFRLVAARVLNWNRDLSPWEAPPVFGKESFGSGAADTLKELLELTGEPGKTYYLGGYSLAGLFALWAAYRTDAFSGIAAASPSVWFPGFIDLAKRSRPACGTVYLSLGDREEKTRNPMMATVGDRIRELYDLLNAQGTDCVLEWNQGNHFKEPDVRTAKAFSWLIGRKNGTL